MATDAVMAIAGATKKMQLLDLLTQHADAETSKEQGMKDDWKYLIHIHEITFVNSFYKYLTQYLLVYTVSS